MGGTTRIPTIPRRVPALLALVAALFATLAAPGAARAAWTRVSGIPALDVYSLRVQGDTLLAGADTALYLSTDAGATWRRTARFTPGFQSVEAAWMHHGRIYAGTLGAGVYVSDDLGLSWSPLNAGLSGGLFDSQLYVTDFEERDGRLYAATDGAGIYVLDLAAPGAWSGFHRQDLEANQAATVTDLARIGTRLVSCGGANGTVFRNEDPGTGWVEEFLDNSGLVPDLTPYAATEVGGAWLVATSAGCFRRSDVASPWEYVGPALGYQLGASFAGEPGCTFAVFQRSGGAHLRASYDAGQTWQAIEILPTFVYDLGLTPGVLWAARGDGLWSSPTSALSAPPHAIAARPGLGLAHAGRHPARDQARVRFTLPAATRAALDLYDVGGRRLDRGVVAELPAGEHHVALDLRGLAAGVYFAQLAADDRVETLRLVRMP